MSDAFIKKNVELSLEFDGYLARHPSLFDEIPNGAYIVITVSGDEKFNADSLSIIRSKKRKRVVEAHKLANRWTLKPFVAHSA